MPRPGPHLRMLAAGVRSLFVHRAPPSGCIEQLAVATGAARQGEDAVPEIEMSDQAFPQQPPGDLLGRFMLGLESVDPAQPDQIGHAHFHGHGAAMGRAILTQATPVAAPGLRTVNVDDGDRGFQCCKGHPMG